MLSYWILRTLDDAPVGLVRVENDRVLLTVRAAAPTAFRLFSRDEDAPIVPEEAVRFADAEALLGTRDGRLCAYACAPNAAPLSVYSDRLSCICTMQSQPEPEEAPPAQQAAPLAPKESAPAPEEAPPREVQTFSEVSDTARATEAFSEMLRRASAFYARFETFHAPTSDNMVQKEDMQPEPQRGIDLLPQQFPGARWRYVEGKDLLGHFEGAYRSPGGESVRILAVRGKYAPRPPRTLAGFTRFVRAPDGTGYWLRFLPGTE